MFLMSDVSRPVFVVLLIFIFLTCNFFLLPIQTSGCLLPTDLFIIWVWQYGSIFAKQNLSK